MKPLPRRFFARDTEVVARELLGCVLTTRHRGVVTAGRIVEVEAYLGEEDPAAHCFGGRRTERTESMYGPPGMAYVYFTYGMHWCINAVTRPAGQPSAVLIRALEPLEGLPAMRRRRGVQGDRALCAGPARLCQALRISGAMDGVWLDSGRITLAGPADPRGFEVDAGPRIGISKAREWPLRYSIRGSPWLSRRPTARS